MWHSQVDEAELRAMKTTWKELGVDVFAATAVAIEMCERFLSMAISFWNSELKAMARTLQAAAAAPSLVGSSKLLTDKSMQNALKAAAKAVSDKKMIQVATEALAVVSTFEKVRRAGPPRNSNSSEFKI